MWTHPDFEDVAALFTARTGIPIPAQRQPYVEAGIRRVMHKLRVSSAPLLRERIAAEQEALDEIIRELAMGETYFFREPSHFEFVRHRFLPRLHERRGDAHVIRAWSAGCSTGEEPYSLAILFEEQGITERAKILGTDISPRAIELAKHGAYRSWSLRGAGAELARPHMRLAGGRWHIDGRIKRRVEFRVLNLVTDPIPTLASGVWEMDLVFCRNVLIYFSRETVALVAKKLADSLAEGGVLVTGPSDPQLGPYAPLEPLVVPEGVFYKRREPVVVPVHAHVRSTPAPAVSPEPAPLELTVACTAVAPQASEVVQAAEAALASGEYRRAADITEDITLGTDVGLLHVQALGNLNQRAAADACEKALSLYPLSIELRYLLANMLFALGQTVDAEREARRVLYLDRSLAVGHALLGMILKQRGDREAARRSFRNAWRICSATPAEALVPLADGETAGILGRAVASELTSLAGPDEAGT